MRRSTASNKILRIADLFCGAGGTSTGAIRAAERMGYKVELTAINHWDVAIETHKANHPDARHLCTSVDNVDPHTLYKPGELFLLLASPECTEHSYAKGGRPVNDQRRVTAWCVVRWAEALLPPVILVENVAQFLKWGPIDSKGKPIKKRRGEVYQAWKATLTALGYKVDHKIMKCDRYGAPTTRARLIVQCVRGKRRIVWPEETHAPLNMIDAAVRLKPDLFIAGMKPSVPARDIIDWSLEGRWLDEMPAKRQYDGLPLSPKTLRRIFAGFELHGMKPFVLPQNSGGNRARSTEEPVPTAAGRGIGSLVEPFVVQIDNTGGNGKCVRSIHQGLSTITSKNGHCVLEPFVVEMRGSSESHLRSSSRSVNDPLGALTAGGTHNVLVEPFIVQCTHGNGSDPHGDVRRTRSVHDPLPVVCGRGDLCVLEPHVLPQHGGGALRPVSESMPTVATAGAIALVQPYIIKFYGTGGSSSIEEPLHTVTGNDRFALLCPEIGMSDGTRRRVRFRFRMFQPHELQLAQGFPKEYQFAGNKSEKVKQIGNAVPSHLADALVSARLRAERRVA